MVQLSTFIVLALTAATTLASPHGHGHGHGSALRHRAVAIQARGTRACRDKVVPPPVNKLEKSAGSSSTKDSTSTKSSSTSKSSTSTKTGTSTKTKTDDEPTPSSTKETSAGSGSGPSAGTNTGSTAAFFPLSLSSAAQSFSTHPGAGKAMALSDATLHPQKMAKNTGHTYTKGPDGVLSMKAVFNRGSISPGHSSTMGGVTMYAPGPIDLSGGNTIIFSYSVLFEKGFSFNKGGKLPGLYGGEDDEIATKCSGGRHDPRCWSTRMMWREGGAGELYAYLPQSAGNNKAYKSVPPHTSPNDDYGASVGRGLWKWTPGKRQVIAQRITLNTPGKFDGQIEIYIDGESQFVAHGLSFRSSAKSKARGMQIQTFFGGHDSSWASPKTQSVYFADFSCAVYH